MFSAANDIIPPLRPQRGRGDGAVGATLMRSANQFNKRAPPRNGRARQRRRMEGEGQTQRRETNALTSHRAPRNVRASLGGATGTSHARAGAATRTSCAWAGTARSCTTKLPRRLAQERDGARDPSGYVGPMAAPHTKRGGGAQAAGASRYPPLAPLLPHPARNTQTKHPEMARFARHA